MKKPYKRKPGDFEIRILKNGRIVMAAPDDSLIEIAQTVEDMYCRKEITEEKNEYVRRENEQHE